MAKKKAKKEELRELESFFHSLIKLNGGKVDEKWLQILAKKGYTYKKNANKIIIADTEPQEMNDCLKMIQMCLLEDPPETETKLQERIEFYAVNIIKLDKFQRQIELNELSKKFYEKGKLDALNQIRRMNWSFQFGFEDGDGKTLQLIAKRDGEEDHIPETKGEA